MIPFGLSTRPFSFQLLRILSYISSNHGKQVLSRHTYSTDILFIPASTNFYHSFGVDVQSLSMFYPILRYNGPDDDSLLEEYTEREGKLSIYIAVSQNPLHWRIVWLRDSRDVGSQGYCDVEIMIPDTSTTGDYHFRFSIRPVTSRSVTQWKLYLVGELNRESRESLPNLAEQLAQPAKVGDMKNNCVTCVQSILLLLCSDDRNKIEAGEALDKTVVESVLKNAWELSKSGLGMQHQQT